MFKLWCEWGICLIIDFYCPNLNWGMISFERQMKLTIKVNSYQPNFFQPIWNNNNISKYPGFPFFFFQQVRISARPWKV